jgi:ribonuclease HI
MSKPESSAMAHHLSQVQDLDALTRLLRIPNDWDFLIIGDGSATTWQHEAGCASVLVERGRGPYPRCRMFAAAFSCGTNIVAEMMAAVHPLLWLGSQAWKGFRRVHVLTDCEMVAKCGNKTMTMNANRELWFLLHAFEHRGMIVRYHWIPRDILQANQLAHAMANRARRWAKDFFLDQVCDELVALRLQDLNSVIPSAV